MNGQKISLSVEELGQRTLPSGFGFWGSFFGGLSSTVQADLAQLHTDTQQLRTDLTTLAPTLQEDRADARATLLADQQAIFAATDSTARMAAITQFRTDLAAARDTLKADRAAVRDAIQADADVAAAVAQLQADLAPIIADKAAIQADLAQLRTDIQTHA
jgi:chromosome segregation ATPase